MEEKLRGIVIGSRDYKEKDKEIVLFSLEKGKIYAILKGVKNPNAKLKFAKEIFCFGDYVITEGKAGKIVTSCEPIDTFFDLTKNYEAFKEASFILETTKVVSACGEPNPALFVEVLKALKCLCYENIKPKYVSCKFLISIFEGLGYKLSLNKCCYCGGPFVNKRFLNLDTGEVVCFGCKAPNSVEISSVTHSALRVLSATNYEKLTSLKLALNSEISAFDLLKQNFEYRFSKKIKNF